MRLNNKIQFTSITVSIPDGAGGVIVTDTGEFNTWAYIEQLSARKDIELAQINLPETYRVKIRDRNGFIPNKTNTVIWRLKEFEITSTPTVDFVNRSRYLVFDMVAKK